MTNRPATPTLPALEPWPLPEKYEVQLFEFGRIGQRDLGYLSVAEWPGKVPFEVNRVFWAYFTPEDVIRGQHAHYRTQQVLIAVAGQITVTLEWPDGSQASVRLERPNQGVYVPPYAWHTMRYSHSAVQLVLASTAYDEADYIRDYETYRAVYGR